MGKRWRERAAGSWLGFWSVLTIDFVKSQGLSCFTTSLRETLLENSSLDGAGAS